MLRNKGERERVRKRRRKIRLSATFPKQNAKLSGKRLQTGFLSGEKLKTNEEEQGEGISGKTEKIWGKKVAGVRDHGHA